MSDFPSRSHPPPSRRAPWRRRPGSIFRGLVTHSPLLLLGAAIALFMALVLTERLAPLDETRRRPPVDSRLTDPYRSVVPSPIALSPMGGMRSSGSFPSFRRFDLATESFPDDMPPLERLQRHAALLGYRKTAWLSIDDPLRLLRHGLDMGIVPRGPLIPTADHLQLLEERLHGPGLIAFDNRSGGWTLVIPTREPHDTIQQLATDTGVAFHDLFQGDDAERIRRIMELHINPEAFAAHVVPFSGTLWIITHEGIDALIISNEMFEGRRFVSNMARGQHAMDPQDLNNHEILQWPLGFEEGWETDGVIESRFVLHAPMAAANTSANSEALRMGEWLLGVSQWSTLQGRAALSPDGLVEWQLRADMIEGGVRHAAVTELLGNGTARPLMAELPAGSRAAIAVNLRSLTLTYDAWRDHLVSMGFPGGAEGIARAERELAMSLGFWIRESLLPLLGDRIAVATYGTGAEETWLVVAETRDPRSVERMIASATMRLEEEVSLTTIDGVTLVAGTEGTRPRAWRTSGNRIIVACGPLSESLIAQKQSATVADVVAAIDSTAGDSPLVFHLSGALDHLTASPLTNVGSVTGILRMEDGAMVLRGFAHGSHPLRPAHAAALPQTVD